MFGCLEVYISCAGFMNNEWSKFELDSSSSTSNHKVERQIFNANILRGQEHVRMIPITSQSCIYYCPVQQHEVVQSFSRAPMLMHQYVSACCMFSSSRHTI